MDKIRKDDGRDDAKVDLNDPNDISYAAQQAGISAEKYKEYAKAAGTSGRQAIAKYIEEHEKQA
ncbi:MULTISPECIES: hypothetical protein [unclassified Pedobacter]|jgi:hypothetical protein|uniref:hypothetical protein n=1 Tax=Pedobacter TaxID=84567 RepID=UPI000B4B99E5|nr:MULTISPECIES: hypothetical protein [unclassified Pedobacter]MCX2430160.1 hypothetical protein [Pedobacter sp. GR22-10]MCX2585747.1 hypothetical protein [Pedobacter sp. MR22-3]OWK70361.1 hypothetical protein CBW18_12940 [Pedobacter sp. AJM]